MTPDELLLLARRDPYEFDRCRVMMGGLAEFVRLAWHLVESTPLHFEPHMKLMCDHYEAVSRGELKELVVNVPPGMSKSIITNVFWPAWDWIHNPWRKWIFTSYSPKLTANDAARCAAIIQSSWFQARFGYSANPQQLKSWGITPLALMDKGRKRSDKIAATDYYTTGGGRRFSTMFGGAVTGVHAHFLIADDPTMPQLIQKGGPGAAEILKTTSYRWKNVFGNRWADAATFAKVIIMQRLHEDDLAGEAIKDGYTALVLPMRYEPARHCRTPWGQDWRTVENQLLAPRRFPEAIMYKMEHTAQGMSARDWASQMQQRPSPMAGMLFQREWFNKRWSVLPSGIILLQSWDCTFKDRKDNDFVAGHVWGKKGADLYFVDRIHARLDLTGTCQGVRDFRKKWPSARQILIEDKANGPAVEQTLRKEVGGILLVNPQGGKYARANAVEPYYRAGNVWYPNEPWVGEVIEEHVGFPAAKHDDDVDAGSQAVIHFEGKAKNASLLMRAMANVDV